MGGQILLSRATQELVREQLPPGVTMCDLSEHRLKDLIYSEQIYQLVAPDLPTDFPHCAPPEATAPTYPHSRPR